MITATVRNPSVRVARVARVANHEGFIVETPIFTTRDKAQNFLVELKRIGFFDDEYDDPKIVELENGFAVVVVDKLDGGHNFVDATVCVTVSSMRL